MTRVAALVILLVVIVASGFWLARDRSTPTGGGAVGEVAADAAPAAAQPGTPTPAASEAGQAEVGAGGEPVGAPAAAGEAASDPAPTALTLPAGYEQVPYLVDEPQQAFDAPQQVLDPDLDYVAVLRTNRGDLTVDLYSRRAPNTVNNFVFLALNHFYDGVPFHRVLEGFMAQTGDPTGTGRGGPGYQFDDEIAADLHFDARGILAMANAGKAADGSGTNGSQFFITFEPTPWLDGNHTIFGHVIAGDPVLDAITRVDPGTPSVIAYVDEPATDLAAKGIDLPAAEGQTVGDAVEALLGTMPVAGQSFNLAGYVVAVGQAGGEPAFGFFRAPDQLETVVIAARPRE